MTGRVARWTFSNAVSGGCAPRIAQLTRRESGLATCELRIVKDVPGIDAWLMDAEYSRPGCLITWYENDAINACFDEEAQHMGENGPCQPNVALPIHLDKPVKQLDEEVRRVFDHASAMIRSLASAAKIVELVRNLYDEYLREHRLEPGLSVEPGAAGVREEQL